MRRAAQGKGFYGIAMHGDGGLLVVIGRMKQNQIFNSRLALPDRIFALSSSQSGTLSIQSVAGGLATNGQSTANRIWSTPISMTQHSSAGLEKLPLVVM